MTTPNPNVACPAGQTHLSFDIGCHAPRDMDLDHFSLGASVSQGNE